MKNYLKKIIEKSSKESSKRFISIWTMCLVTIVVLGIIYYRYDLTTTLITLLGFLGSLIGISTWENKRDKNVKD